MTFKYYTLISPVCSISWSNHNRFMLQDIIIFRVLLMRPNPESTQVLDCQQQSTGLMR